MGGSGFGEISCCCGRDQQMRKSDGYFELCFQLRSRGAAHQLTSVMNCPFLVGFWRKIDWSPELYRDTLRLLSDTLVVIQ
jgi:hypothetical protein